MNKISKAVAEQHKREADEKVLRKSEIVTNFMGGDSYKVDPLTTLRMITSSSIFGEPSYYRGSGMGTKGSVAYVERSLPYAIAELLKENDVLGIMGDHKDTVTIMEEAIDAALDYDFKGTLEWAATLRNDFFVRLNPQVIMVRAAQHPKRQEFTEEFKGIFGDINARVMSRADDAMSQISYYMYVNGNKNKMPSILKRSWAKHFSKLNRYAVAKYKNHDMGMINAVRICHANSDVINELMSTGTVAVSEDEKTWENLRSAGMGWADIFKSINMGHMAMLRNIRNFLEEVDDINLVKEYMDKLKAGVLKGKQFPFRYYSAYRALQEHTGKLNFLQIGLDTLEECIDISIENMPKLNGRVMCLSDNSGSAWGSLNTEYGTVTVAEIDNLSSVITAMRSDDGYVGKFGDKLIVYPISKREGAIKQAMKISSGSTKDVGGGTEGGIWEFFHGAIENHEHWDTVFIYSDQQAGTGGLYGTNAQKRAYRDGGYGLTNGYINVFKLVLDYRKKVNSKLNAFSVQTAGYNNSVLPLYAYRTNLLYGWTGKEILFADAMIKEWDRLEEGTSKTKKKVKLVDTKDKPVCEEAVQFRGQTTSKSKPKAKAGSKPTTKQKTKK